MIIYDNTPEDKIGFFSDEIAEIHKIGPCMCGTMPKEKVERNEKYVKHIIECPECGFYSEVSYSIEANRDAPPTTLTGLRLKSILVWNSSVKKNRRA